MTCARCPAERRPPARAVERPARGCDHVTDAIAEDARTRVDWRRVTPGAGRCCAGASPAAHPRALSGSPLRVVPTRGQGRAPPLAEIRASLSLLPVAAPLRRS